MRIIVAGAWRIWYSVASELSKERHDITVIERSAAVCAEVSDTLDVFAINGNTAACDDVFVALTGDNDDNVITSIQCRMHMTSASTLCIIPFPYS